MKRQEISTLLINEESIKIQLGENTAEQFPHFVLRNRKSKEEHEIPVTSGSNANELVLSYEEIDLEGDRLNRYDLFIANQDGQLCRPKLRNSQLDFKNIKTAPFHFRNQDSGFKFYVTKDKEIALIQGDYITVEKEFHKRKKIDFFIKDVSLVKNQFQFTLLGHPINTKLFFWWEGKKSTLPVKTVATLKADHEWDISLLIDAVILEKIEDWKLRVAFLKDEILYEGKLLIEKGQLNHFSRNGDAFYYTDEKHEIAFISNPLLYLKQFGQVDKEKHVIDHYSLGDKEIRIVWKGAWYGEEIYLFLEDITNGHFSRVVDFKQDEYGLTIPNMIAEKDIHGMVGNRYRFMMITKRTVDEEELGESSPYQCVGFYINYYGPLKSEKYGEKLELSEEHVVLPYWSVHNEFIFQVLKQEQYLATRYERVNVHYSCNNLQINRNSLQFILENVDDTDADKMKFYVEERKNKDKVYLHAVIEKGNAVKLDFSSFIDNLELTASRWDLYVEIYKSEAIVYGKVGCFSSSVRDKYERYFAPLNQLIEEDDLVLLPYLTLKNEISFIWNNEAKIRNEQLECKVALTDSRVEGNIIYTKVKLTNIGVNHYEIESGTIMLRNKATHLAYEVPIEILEKEENHCEVLVSIDPSIYYLIPFFWDVYVNIKVDDIIYPVRVKNPSKSVKNHIDYQINENEIDVADGFMMYPYITADNSYALCFRERAVYENKWNRFKEKLAYHVYKRFQNYFDKKDIWLSYEKNASTAQDNGYQFFNYCYNNKKKENFYYIIKKDAVDYQDIKHQKKNILTFMSFKYMVYMYAAKLLISSESKGHSYDIRIQKGKLKEFLDKKKFVFLQHGVTALKKVDYVFKKKKDNAVSLFTAVSEYEKKIIKEYFNYNDAEIMVTGFTRWDVLEDKSTLADKKIFIMPTWRSWMDGIREEEFIKSVYYQKYREILESKVLNELLEQNNITLHFLLHPKFIAYSNKFDLGGNRIVTHQFGEIKINEMLMESSLLITDYSSVAWEFYYMKKPTIFFQFDREEYCKHQGSYLDLENELFGDSAQGVNDLLAHIHYYIDNDFKEKEEYATMRGKYFKYVDKKNSERTFKQIMKNKKRLYGNK